MQKLNRSRFFSRDGDSLPIFFKKMEKRKTTAATKRGRGRRGIFKKREEGLFSLFVVSGGRAYVGGGGIPP